MLKFKLKGSINIFGLCFRYAAEHGIIVVGPDTSPRGVKLPGDDESWDFGVSAGFYLDATMEPWSKHYKMGNYINVELYDLILTAFSNVVDPKRVGIMGHRLVYLCFATCLA